MKSYIGKKVMHKKFGQGTIISIENGKVVVNFSTMEKTFQFPDAFDSFLVFKDSACQAEAELLVAEQKKQKAEDFEKRAKEREIKAIQIQKEKIDKRCTRIEPHRDFISKGDTFATHNDALNECFGFQYEHYQPAYKVIDDRFAVWFPSIAQIVRGEYAPTDTSNGWINVISEGDTVITEKHEDKSKNTDRDDKYELDRFVFAKFDGENYRFVGVYRSELVDRPWETGYKYRLIGTKVNLKTMEIL